MAKKNAPVTGSEEKVAVTVPADEVIPADASAEIKPEIITDLTAEEREMGEKSGLIKKPETPEEKTAREEKEKKDAADKLLNETPDEKKAREKKEAEDKAAADKKSESDKKDKTPAPGEEPTEEQLKKYNPNERALYFKQKKEKQKRQEVESERNHLNLRMKTLKEKYPDVYASITGETPELADPDKTFTPDEVKDRDKIKEEDDAQRTEKARLIHDKSVLEEKEARLKYPDFDSVIKLSNEVLKIQAENQKANRPVSARVMRLYKSFMEAATNLSGDTDETACDIAYEIGKLHPDYKPGKSDIKSEDEPPKSPDAKTGTSDIDRMIDHATTPMSSAAIGEGTKDKIVPENELTPEQGAKLPTKEWAKLSKATQDRLLKAVG